MWVEVKKAPNLIMAEMWKDFFEGEGVPARVLPDHDEPGIGGAPKYSVLVSREKVHVIEEMLRKL